MDAYQYIRTLKGYSPEESIEDLSYSLSIRQICQLMDQFLESELQKEKELVEKIGEAKIYWGTPENLKSARWKDAGAIINELEDKLKMAEDLLTEFDWQWYGNKFFTSNVGRATDKQKQYLKALLTNTDNGNS